LGRFHKLRQDTAHAFDVVWRVGAMGGNRFLKPGQGFRDRTYVAGYFANVDRDIDTAISYPCDYDVEF
jgi:hypothetical protein